MNYTYFSTGTAFQFDVNFSISQRLSRVCESIATGLSSFPQTLPHQCQQRSRFFSGEWSRPSTFPQALLLVLRIQTMIYFLVELGSPTVTTEVCHAIYR
jgi:hypothetical protein